MRAHLATFFPNLPEEMAKAHLVIGRAGASTVAELTVMGRPAILVPLPHAIDNDQLQNALGCPKPARPGAWSRRTTRRTSSPRRWPTCSTSPETLARGGRRRQAQGRPDAVTRLADLVEELVGRGRESA